MCLGKQQHSVKSLIVKIEMGVGDFFHFLSSFDTETRSDIAATDPDTSLEVLSIMAGGKLIRVFECVGYVLLDITNSKSRKEPDVKSFRCLIDCKNSLT